MIDFSSEFFKCSNFDPEFIRNHECIDDWKKLDNEFNKWLSRKDTAPAKIPKTIHQIWLGGKLPDKYTKWTESWLIHNPDYKYIFWDDQNVKNLEIINHPFFKEQKNQAAKSDILRYAILNKYGGIYADTDFECLRPIPNNLRSLTGFAGLVYGMKPNINNAIIGSVPNSAILKYFLSLLDSLPIKNLENVNDILNTTGPYKFTQIFLEKFINIQQHDFLILPNIFMYPHPKYIPFTSLSSSKLVTPKTFATHHWDCSWMRPNLAQRISLKLKILKKSIHI